MRALVAAPVLAAVLVGACQVPATAAPSQGTGTVLLIDNHRVERTTHLYKQFLRGRKITLGYGAGQIDVPQTDQDSTLLDVTSVLHEGSRWRMYLRSGTNVGYRESEDGLHWHTAGDPVIVTGVSGGSVVKDPLTGQYYLMGWNKAARHYVEMVSDDGVHFRDSGNFTGALSQLGGDAIAAFADPVTRTIGAIAKQKTTGGVRCTKSSRTTYSGGRTFGVNVTPSSTARYWRTPTVRLTADCTDEYSVPPTSATVRPVQLYGANALRYGDQFLAFPQIFRVTTAPAAKNQSGWVDGPVDTQIASTPDIARTMWTRPAATVRVGARKARPNLISRGANGAWDDGMLYGISMINVGTDSRMYYNGWDSTHMPTTGRHVHVGVATWKRDRFMALRNTGGRGVMRTRAFFVPRSGLRRTLHVNGTQRGRQTMRVAVLNARTGRAFKGWAMKDSRVIRGDHLDQQVTWRGKRLGRLRNHAIKLQFSFNGSLYSYAVR